MDKKHGGGAVVPTNVEELLTKQVHSPFGVQMIYTARGEAPSFDKHLMITILKCLILIFTLNDILLYLRFFGFFFFALHSTPTRGFRMS